MSRGAVHGSKVGGWPAPVVDAPTGDDRTHAWQSYLKKHSCDLEAKLKDRNAGQVLTSSKHKAAMKSLAKAALDELSNVEQWEYDFMEEAAQEQETPAYSHLSRANYREDRRNALRAGLNSAAGGDGKEVAIVLKAVLTAEEKDALLGLLLNEVREGCEEARLSCLMKRVAQESCAASSQRNCQVPLDVVLIAARKCGHTSKGVLKKLLNIDIGRKAWERSADQKLHIKRRRNTGRLGTRKVPTAVVAELLHKNSTPTCKPFEGGRGRKRKAESSADGPREVKQMRALTDSINSIHFSSDALCQTCDPSYLHMVLKRDFPWIRAASRKLDCCMKCRQWDWQVLPMVRKSLKEYIHSLNSIHAGFCADFWKRIEENSTAHQRHHMVNEVIREFRDFLETRRRGGIKASKKEGLSPKDARALERQIDRIHHEIRTAWPKAKELKVGLLDIICMHQTHFTHRDAYQEVRAKSDQEPAEDTMYYQLDFLQHRTLPMGPEEGGEWWYANARLSITLLVIYTWGRGVRPAYHTYGSHCLEQTPEFTVACLRDLHAKLGGAGKFKNHIMFSDVGNHFRAGYTLGYWGAELLKVVGIDRTQWIFAPEGHGKGVCDGQGGRITAWLNEVAKKNVIATLGKFCSHLRKCAAASEKINPEAAKSFFYDFTPPAKSKLPKCYVDTAGLKKAGTPIRSIYAWTFKHNSSKKPRPVWSAHPLAGRPSDRSSIPDVVDRSPGSGGDNWKTAYRTKKPEKSKLKLGTLAKGWERLKKMGLTLSARRKSWGERCRKFAAARAKKRAAGQAKRSVVKKLHLKAKSSSSSSSNSNSSSSRSESTNRSLSAGSASSGS